jgi:hypothetical protein
VSTLGQRARKRRAMNFILGSVVFLVVALLAAGATYYNLSRPEPLNPNTLCPASGPKGHYVLLVDTTDRLSDIQKQAFTTIVREVVEKRTPEGYLLSIFVLGEDLRHGVGPVVELCNPGNETGKSRFTDNLVFLRRQYEGKFLVPMTQHLESLLNTSPGKQSPILEMLQLVGVNAFRKHDVQGERRLIIMSDMLHHTAQLSMYQVIPEFQAFAATDYGRRAQADLRNVDVELHYLMNNPRLQTMRNMKFWEDYFDKAGARIRQVRPLEG